LADISEIVVNEKLLAKLKNMPEEMRKQVRLTMESVVFECERITKEKLSGPVLHRRSSRLFTSIGSDVKGSGRDTVGRFGVTKHPQGKPVVYAAIHEFGGIIRPKRKKWLRFKTKDGRWHTVKEVTMPMRSYIRSTAKEKKSWIVGRFHSMLTEMGNNLGK
jgi:phage gpG-like protein